MFARKFQDSLAARIIAVIIAVSFVLTNAPLGLSARAYATNNLRQLNGWDGSAPSVAEDILKKNSQNQDGGTTAANAPYAGVNTYSARTGKATGTVDAPNILAAGAQVLYINHSEERALLERMKSLVESVYLSVKKRDGQADKKWTTALELEGLSKDDIEVTLPWLQTLKDQYRVKYDQAELDFLAASLTRDLSNQIQHVKFRELLKTAEEFEKKFGYNPLKQIVLCVGETQQERDRVMKNPKNPDAADLAAGQEEAKRIVERDFTKIIRGYKEGDSIDLDLLKKYDFRVANEARTLIGKTGDIKDWQLEQALDINKFIKELGLQVLGRELPVDYGAGTDGALVKKIGASEYVNGWLIGTAGKKGEDLGKIIDACIEISKAEATKDKAFNIGVNLKAESWKTGVDLLDTMAELLLTKDIGKSRLVIGVNPTMISTALSKTKELGEAMVQTNWQAELLTRNLQKSLNNPEERAKAIAAIEAVNPEIMKPFLSLYLIGPKGRVDADQIAAVKSRLIQLLDKDKAHKTVAVFGSNEIARVVIRDLVQQGYDALELRTVVGKTPGDLLPTLKFDSEQGEFEGRIQTTKDFELFYLGNQPEAVRMFDEKADLSNNVKDLPWEVLGIDMVYVDSDSFSKMKAEGVKIMQDKGIKVLTTNGAGVFFVPGFTKQEDVEKETAIAMTSTLETTAVLGLEVLSKLGDIKLVSTEAILPTKRAFSPSYKEAGAAQAIYTEKALLNSAISKAFPQASIMKTSVIEQPTSHGQTLELNVVVGKKVTADDVKKVFAAAAETSALLRSSGKGEAIASNLVWRMKEIMFSSDKVFVMDMPGGKMTMVKILFDFDENKTIAHQALTLMSGGSFTKEAVAKQEIKDEYIKSEVADILKKAATDKTKKKEADEAAKTAAKVSEVANARNLVLSGGVTKTKAFAKAFDVLLAGQGNVKNAELIKDEQGIIRGLASVEGNKIYSVLLRTAPSLEQVQEYWVAYNNALRRKAIALSAERNAAVEVVDTYRPEDKLRYRLEVNARDHLKTTVKSIDELINGKWTAISEPNQVYDYNEYKDKYSIAIIGAGGTIGGGWVKQASRTDLPELQAFFLIGPDSKRLAAYLDHGDNVQGRYTGTIEYGTDWISLNGKKSIMLSSRVSNAFRSPENIPYMLPLFMGVPIYAAVDATGEFTEAKAINKHRQAGALRAVVTAPGSGEEFDTRTLVMNSNEDMYDPTWMYYVSGASCTTGCLTMSNNGIIVLQLLKMGLLDREAYAKATIRAQKRALVFGAVTKAIEVRALADTGHAYTTDEKLQSDQVGAEKKRGRFIGGYKVYKTTSGAFVAGKLVSRATIVMDGLAIRFPTDTGSLVLPLYMLEGEYTREEVLEAYKIVEEISRGVMLADVDQSNQIKMMKEYKTNMATISPSKIEVAYVKDGDKIYTVVKSNAWYENVDYYIRENAEMVYYQLKAKENQPQLILAADGTLAYEHAIVRGLKADALDKVQVLLNYLGIKDVASLYGKVIAVRIDTNTKLKVDAKTGKKEVPDSEKMKFTAEFSSLLLDLGAKVVFVDHQDKPGEPDYLENLEGVAKLLSKHMGVGKEVAYVDDLYGDKAVAAIKALTPGKAVLLKNVRSYAPETDKKLSIEEQEQTPFVRVLESLIDLDIHQFMSIEHRNNISVQGFTGVPNIAGPFLEKELRANTALTQPANQPYYFVPGGKKADDLGGLIRQGLADGRYAKVFAVGVPGEIFLLAQGYKLGEETEKQLAVFAKGYKSKKYGAGLEGLIKEFADILKDSGDKIELPVDLAAYTDKQVTTDKEGKEKVTWSGRVEIALTDVHKTKPVSDMLIGDIGTVTARKFAAEMQNAKSILKKGTAGIDDQFTKQGEDILVASYEKAAKAETDINTYGGDGTEALAKRGKLGIIKASTVSGGAAVAFASGEELPGFNVLTKWADRIDSISRATDMTRGKVLEGMMANNRLFYATNGGLDYVQFVIDTDKSLVEVPLQGSAAVAVDTSFFQEADGALNTVLWLAKLSRRGLTVALYGQGADNWKTVLNNADIVTADNYGAVLGRLSAINIAPARVTVLTTPKAKLSPEQVSRIKGQVVSGKLGTLAAAKAVATAIGSDAAHQALGALADSMANSGIVSKAAVMEAKQELIAKLEAETADMAQVTIDDEVAENMNLIRLEALEFASRV